MNLIKKNSDYISLYINKDYYKLCHSLVSSESYKYADDSFYKLFKCDNELTEEEKDLIGNIYVSCFNNDRSTLRFSIIGDSFKIDSYNLVFFETTPLEVDTPRDLKKAYNDSISFSPPETMFKIILPLPKNLYKKLKTEDITDIKTPDGLSSKKDFKYNFNSCIKDKFSRSKVASKLQQKIEQSNRKIVKLENNVEFNSGYWTDDKDDEVKLSSEEYNKNNLTDTWEDIFGLNYNSYKNAVVLKNNLVSKLSMLKVNDYVPLDMLDSENEEQCEYCGAVNNKDYILNLKHSYYDETIGVCINCFKWNRKDFVQKNVPNRLIEEAKELEDKYKN